MECVLQFIDELDDAAAAIRQWCLGTGSALEAGLAALLGIGVFAVAILLGASAVAVAAGAVALSMAAAFSLKRRFSRLQIDLSMLAIE
jgi:hypothetical protein